MFMLGGVMAETVRVKRETLEKFCAEVFTHLGVPEDEALASAQVLVAADARGIEISVRAVRGAGDLGGGGGAGAVPQDGVPAGADRL